MVSTTSAIWYPTKMSLGIMRWLSTRKYTLNLPVYVWCLRAGVEFKTREGYLMIYIIFVPPRFHNILAGSEAAPKHHSSTLSLAWYTRRNIWLQNIKSVDDAAKERAYRWLVQYCSSSIAKALESLQSCIKPSICSCGCCAPNSRHTRKVKVNSRIKMHWVSCRCMFGKVISNNDF